MPIEPVSLRQLILSSDLIVVARVEPASAQKKDPNRITILSGFGESPARLRPSTILKGVAPQGFIEVHFNPNMVCPSPPRFPEGSNVLAFLHRSKDTKGYSTIGLSYGAITVSKDEIKMYSERITAWLALERQHPRGIPTNAIVEWLVKCVETPATRAEGAMELGDRQPFLGTNMLRSPFASHLTAQQWLRLSNVVFRSDYIVSGDLSLLRMFARKSKPAVVRHLLGGLRKASKPIPPIDQPYRDHDGLPEPWNTFDGMWLLAEQLDDSGARAFVGNLKRTDFFSTSNRVLQLASFLPIVEAAATKKGFVKPSQSSRN